MKMSLMTIIKGTAITVGLSAASEAIASAPMPAPAPRPMQTAIEGTKPTQSHTKMAKDPEKKYEIASETYVVPDQVYALWQRVSGRFNDASIYISQNLPDWYLGRFSGHYKQAGFSNEDADVIAWIFCTKDHTIFPESLTRDPNFKKYWRHEQLHKQMASLSRKDLDLLIQAHKSIMKEKSKYYSPECFFNIHGGPHISEEGLINAHTIFRNEPDEFYAYLINCPAVEGIYMQKYPEANAIFQRLKREVSAAVPQ